MREAAATFARYEEHHIQRGAIVKALENGGLAEMKRAIRVLES